MHFVSNILLGIEQNVNILGVILCTLTNMNNILAASSMETIYI